jgi:hypothetical protein
MAWSRSVENNMMHRPISLRLGLVLLPALVLASCHVDDEAQGHEFRKVDLGGEGDIAIYEHPSANDDEPIWQFHAGGVHSSSVDGPLIFAIDDDTIRDENDQVLCTRDGDALTEQRIREGGEDGPVLYTVIERQVYAGEPEAGDQPLYSFRGRHVLAGKKGPPLVSADAHIQFVDSMRKLVIVALIDGECGAPGL